MYNVMTSAEAADYLRLGVDTVKRKARAGELPAAKTGRKWVFRRADLDAWLSAGGSRYDRLVDRGLLDAAGQAMAEEGGDIPLAQVPARLGL